MKRIYAIAALLCLASTHSLAADPARLEAAELALNIEKYQGRIVTVTDCVFAMATLGNTFCPILQGQAMLGVIWVGYDARQKELRAEVIRRCNDVKPQMNCFGEATGKVAAGMSADIVLMRDAIIKFKFNR